MTLVIPSYIRYANIQDDVIRYEWDDWGWEKAEEPFDKELATALRRLSQRAILSFMCGTCEWIVRRFVGLCDINAPSNFIEAAWAMLIDLGRVINCYRS